MIAPKLDDNTFAGVLHISCQAHFMRQPPDGWAKPNALNLPRNSETRAFHVAASQIRIRLLPLSATATVDPKEDRP